MGPVLAERARALSRTPELEDVLILAHGPTEDAENEIGWPTSTPARTRYVSALPERAGGDCAKTGRRSASLSSGAFAIS